MDPILAVRGLEVVYHTHLGPLKALHDVSFKVQPGEIVGIVGESGCGKSTVVSALLQLLPPNGEITAGQMVFKGQDLRTLDPSELRRLRGTELAMIFQDPTTSLNPVFSIGTQMLDVRLAHPEEAGSDQKELRRQAIGMLEQVGIPDAPERFDHYPHQFSGGMRQRIMIGMALMSRPGLLIADEPTSSLDVTLEAQIIELIKELRQSLQTSILYISHDLGVIAQLCDQVVVMYAGRAVEQGDVFSVYEQPQHPYTRALLASVPTRRHHGDRLATIPGRVPGLTHLPPGCKFADRCSDAWMLCHEREPPYVDSDGRRIRCHRFDPDLRGSAPPAAGMAMAVRRDDSGLGDRDWQDTADRQTQDSALLQLRQLSTHFYEQQNVVERLLGRERPAVYAVDGVDLQIARGEVMGLVGESGCGKTTLGKTILGLVPAAGGVTLYDSRNIAEFTPGELRRLRARIQMIFQDPYSSLSPRMRVSSLLSEPYKIHRIPAADRYTVSELLNMVELSDELADKYPHELSGGQARRIGIARTLSLQPEFLVADEPTSGLDVSVAASILNLMKDLADQMGLTYLIITHNLNIVGYIADRVAVMYLGRLVEVGRTEQIFETPAHPYTLALLSAVSEPDPRQRRDGRRLLLSGEIPSPKNPPPGCRFHTRCPLVNEDCRGETWSLEEIEPGHYVSCPRWQQAREMDKIR
jgi:peptide/nickel transport system ATP-binding protein